MKNLVLTIAILTFGFNAHQVSSSEIGTFTTYDGNKFIFVEGGIEFSVFPDGQFDFVYLGNQGTEVTISTPNVAVSFNSGYNYDAYVQYDSYGAVIQIEDTPIYYDEYGRIIQAGNVTIRYNNRRLVQVGGLYVHYNPYGHYSHYSGYINVYNRYYVYRPWHVYYSIPHYSYCLVYTHPYRRYYTPVRYSYSHHRRYYNSGRSYMNGRRDFYRPGSRVHHKDGRVALNRNFNSRGRGVKEASTTYKRDDKLIRSNFNSRVESQSQRGTSVASSERNNTIHRGKPARSTQRTTNRVINLNSVSNRIDRNRTVQREKPASTRIKKIDRSSRVTQNRPTSIQNKRTQNVVKKQTTNRQSTTVGKPVARQQKSSTSRSNNSGRNSSNRGGRG